MLTALHLDAGHDTNGNPRRIYIILEAETADIIDAVDEGYRGRRALEIWADEHNAPEVAKLRPPTIATTATERRDLLRNAAEGYGYWWTRNKKRLDAAGLPHVPGMVERFAP